MPSIIVHGGAGHYSPGEEHEAGVVAAARAGWEVLSGGGVAVDAVEAAIRVMEDNPIFRAGLGSPLNFRGEIEQDASIMLGDLSCGAVGAMKAGVSAIRAARLVMERTDHVMLVGAGADAFVRRMGLAERELRTGHELELHRKLMEQFRSGDDIKFMPRLRSLSPDDELGTVGAAAVDAESGVAAGTSTGGMRMKLPGRVGDSALIGAGTYADAHGGASATGRGEPIIRHAFCKVAVDAIGTMGAREALEMVIEIGRAHGVSYGIIGVEENGAVAHAYSTRAMAWASLREGELETFVTAGEQVGDE